MQLAADRYEVHISTPLGGMWGEEIEQIMTSFLNFIPQKGLSINHYVKFRMDGLDYCPPSSFLRFILP